MWLSASKVYVGIKGVTVIHSSNSNITIICCMKSLVLYINFINWVSGTNQRIMHCVWDGHYDIMTSKVHLQYIYTQAGHKVRLTELFASCFCLTNMLITKALCIQFPSVWTLKVSSVWKACPIQTRTLESMSKVIGLRPGFRSRGYG